MKKVLLSILAVAAMASCVQSEDVNPQQLIDFGSPFVGGTTKAIDYSYGAENLLKDIYVYGSVTGTSGNPSLVFNHTHVYSEGTTEDTIYNQLWKYDGGPKYWVPGADYKFVALAGVAETAVTEYALPSVDAYLPSKITFEGDGKTDLLLSAVSRSNVGASGNETVAFTMQHLLSKVKFTVNNTSTLGEDYYKVTNIKITNAYTEGDCAISYTGDVDAGTWAATTAWTTDETAVVNFGHATALDAATMGAAAMNLTAGAKAASNYDYLVVPYNYSATKMHVSFELALYDKSGVEINSPAEKTADVVIELKSGYQYNFIINLAFAQAIDFTVTGAPTWSDDTAQSQVVSGTFN